MNYDELNGRLLDVSIKVMERNRILLFTINLIAALILVVVFLENLSSDDQLRRGHLIAYKGICEKLSSSLELDKPNFNLQNDLTTNVNSNTRKNFINNSTPNLQKNSNNDSNYGLSGNKTFGKFNISEKDKETISACKDLLQISSILISTKGINEDTFKELSTMLFRLNRIQNEMRNVQLEPANVSPLGLGMSVPRNDLVLICGILLVVLYTWLVFSFKQHARIIKEIMQNIIPKEPDNKDSYNKISRLIEMNFMFRTNKGVILTFFVIVLYILAPLAMTIAIINEFYTRIIKIGSAEKMYQNYMNEISIIPLMIEVGIVLVLWLIAYHIIVADKETNIVYKQLEDNSPTTQ